MSVVSVTIGRSCSDSKLWTLDISVKFEKVKITYIIYEPYALSKKTWEQLISGTSVRTNVLSFDNDKYSFIVENSGQGDDQTCLVEIGKDILIESLKCAIDEAISKNYKFST